MVITAPMKNDMTDTIEMELNPNFSISTHICLKKIRGLSGKTNTFFIKRKYCPTKINDLLIILYCYISFRKERFDLNVHIFSGKPELFVQNVVRSRKTE